MVELFKRFSTSLLLGLLLLISLYHHHVLIMLLILILYQVIYEFNNIIKKIFIKNKFKQFLSLIFILFFVLYVIFFVWFSLESENIENRRIFYIILTITIASDIGGFIFGKLFKGKKLTKYSPNKTYSGMFGSYILSFFFTYILFQTYIIGFEFFVIIFILSTIAQLGDLFISFLKRKAKIKDTGKLLPGHGGLLDRFDGLLFTIATGSFLFNIT